MDATARMKRKKFAFGLDGRFSVTVECADDLNHDEARMMDYWLEDVRSFVGLHAKFTDEEMKAIFLEAVAETDRQRHQATPKENCGD